MRPEQILPTITMSINKPKKVCKRVCLDCGAKLKNRSKTTKRCAFCHLAKKNLMKKGRSLPSCAKCGSKLSTVKNSTGLCKNCYEPDSKRMSEIMKGNVPWNKGTSKFKSREQYITHKNTLRKLKRSKQPPEAHLSDRIRTLIRNQVKKVPTRCKKSKTSDLLGCSVLEFRKHLQKQFNGGMSWVNYGNGCGKWNIDHIIPVTLYDLSTIDGQKAAFNYKNCRPLWAIENIKRGNRSLI
jgi:hypothetical protein